MSGDVEMRDAGKRNEDDEWVRITSRDGYSFIVKRRVANASGTLQDMLNTDTNFAEAISKTCPVDERGSLVEKTLEYMAFKKAFDNTPPKEEIPVNEFLERIPTEVALELLLLADYLNV